MDSLFEISRTAILLIVIGICGTPTASFAQELDLTANQMHSVARIWSIDGRRVDNCIYWRKAKRFVVLSALYGVWVVDAATDTPKVQRLPIERPAWICEAEDRLIIGLAPVDAAIGQVSDSQIQVFARDLSSERMTVEGMPAGVQFASCVGDIAGETVLFCASSTPTKVAEEVAGVNAQQLVRIGNQAATVIGRRTEFISSNGSIPVFARLREDVVAVGLQPATLVFGNIHEVRDLEVSAKLSGNLDDTIDLNPLSGCTRAAFTANLRRAAFATDERLWIIDPMSKSLFSVDVELSGCRSMAVLEDGTAVLLFGNGLTALSLENSVTKTRRNRLKWTIKERGAEYMCGAVDEDGKIAICGTVDGYIDLITLPQK
ncbi:MAG: hypothetical protein U0996_10705 [Planctomycetaceae bacterium]